MSHCLGISMAFKLLYWLCQSLCVNHNKLWKILKEMGLPDYLTCLLRNLYAGQEATVRTGHGTADWSQSGKEYIDTVYCHPASLTYMQSTSWEMLGWMKHKLEARLPITNNNSQSRLRNINNLKWYNSNGRELRGTKESFDEDETEEWKSGLKLNIQKIEFMAFSPITSW